MVNVCAEECCRNGRSGALLRECLVEDKYSLGRLVYG